MSAPTLPAPAGVRRLGRWALHDGAFAETADLHLGPGLQALSYGTGVFEGIRAYLGDDGRPHVFRLREHYEWSGWSGRPACCGWSCRYRPATCAG